MRAVLDRGPGVAKLHQVAGLSGLQTMQVLLQGEIPYSAIAKTLDFLVIEVNPGRAVFQGAPRSTHFNPMGGIHGGWYATLLYSALGCAVHTALPTERGYTTAEARIIGLDSTLYAHGTTTCPVFEQSTA